MWINNKWVKEAKIRRRNKPYWRFLYDESEGAYTYTTRYGNTYRLALVNNNDIHIDISRYHGSFIEWLPCYPSEISLDYIEVANVIIKFK